MIVNLETIQDIFRQIEPQFDGHKIQIKKLKKQLNNLNIDFNIEEQGLISHKKYITSGQLYEIIKNNDLGEFDPMESAFKLLDKENRGYLEIGQLNDLFQQFGFPKLAFKEQEAMLECLDVDNDGVISIKDLK